MIAEPDLPINDAVPAPTKIEPGNLFLWNWRQMQVYAQACVAYATAAKDAEIEALRAEVATWEGLHASEVQVRQRWQARADRLAEALRKWWAEHRPVGWTEDQHRACPYVNLATDAEKALATALLRDQEEGK